MPAAEITLSSLAAVVVLHDSGDVVAECLRSIPDGVEVVVVDNASRDDGAARARAVRPDATLIGSPVNRGFGGGCNLGWRVTRRPVIAFLNPDLRLEPDTLSRLLDRLAREPHAMVGPALLDASGRPARCKSAPSALVEAAGLLPAAARFAPPGWDNKLPADAPVHTHGGPVAALEGACFLIRRDDLEAIGGFDETLFLYSEEEDLALRLAGVGGRPIYEPRARAFHVGGTSTEKVSTFAIRHRYRSRVIYYRRRDGAVRGRLAALALALAATLSLLAAILNGARGAPGLLSPAHWRAVVRGIVEGSLASLRAPVGA